MIILTCVAVPRPGSMEEACEAARELAAASQAHGMVGYYWTLDSLGSSLRVVEVHEGPDSVVHHIRSSDVARLAAAAEFRDIQVWGDPPSPEMTAALEPFGDYEYWKTLAP